MITMALSKGRIFDDTLPLLKKAGVTVDAGKADSRELVLPTSDPQLRVIIVRATDVPIYVQHGAADLGVAGQDVLIEHGGVGLYQPVDLGIAQCRLSVATAAGFDYASAVTPGSSLTIATKYVTSARNHFEARGVHVDLIKLYGSMELAPIVGLADAIVDLVSTGGTLSANNLVETEVIMPVSARLAVNPAALKLKGEPLRSLITRLAQAASGAG